jgi:hypothetical protein
MADPTERPGTPGTTGARTSPDPHRRRLIRSGLGAAPLLLTLVSRPVLGQQCFTPSGFISMPTSQHGETQVCLGRTPGYWKQEQHFEAWPPPYHAISLPAYGGPIATQFIQVFAPSPYPAETTFLQVLEMGDGPLNSLARHIVASVLNVASGWVTVLSVMRLQEMWSECVNTGYYEPTAGVKWTYDQMTAYLQSTMTL